MCEIEDARTIRFRAFRVDSSLRGNYCREIQRDASSVDLSPFVLPPSPPSSFFFSFIGQKYYALVEGCKERALARASLYIPLNLKSVRM